MSRVVHLSVLSEVLPAPSLSVSFALNSLTVMPVAFGFSIGDFIAVGGLITKIVTELKVNGSAAQQYQCLLLELEALRHALDQLDQLNAAQNEIVHLDSIRASARLCEKPVEEFLSKILKFDKTLGATNTRGESSRKGDALLANALSTHQTELFNGVKLDTHEVLEQSRHSAITLKKQAEQLRNIETSVVMVKEHCGSLLKAATSVMAAATSGFVALRSIKEQIQRTFRM
ncbi:MAG: hypothetical protein M1827_006021 [Pycnora praestabilis]|nr:MAG: hypothetical protein M1827_006021 [Pycnora praestabilis]